MSLTIQVMPMRTVSGFDTNLFYLFDAIARHGSVTRAAAELGISQGAASKGLNKLRSHYRDALFLKTRDGMAATEHAVALHPVIARFIQVSRDTLHFGTEFDPATSARHVSIGLMDLTEAMAMQRLLPRIRVAAPRCTVEVVPIWVGDISRAFEDRSIDLAISSGYRFAGEVRQQKLLEHDFVVVAHPKNPLGQTIDIAEFEQFDYVMVAPPGRSGTFVERALEQQGMTVRPLLRSPHGLALAQLVATMDSAVSILPRSMAEEQRRKLGLRILEPQFELPKIEVLQYWHARSNNDPFSVWLRGVIRQCFFHAPDLHIEH
jgi:DNA-binding transcriptional LysR family regulator